MPTAPSMLVDGSGFISGVLTYDDDISFSPIPCAWTASLRSPLSSA